MSRAISLPVPVATHGCPICGEPLPASKVENFSILVLGRGDVLACHAECFHKSFKHALATGLNAAKVRCRNCGRLMSEWHKGKDVTLIPNHGSDGACFHNPGTTFAPDSASLAKASPFVRSNWAAQGVT